MLKRIKDVKEIENIIENSPEGRNTKFLSSSHSLWYRFKNYDRHPPFVMYDKDLPVGLVYATYSQRTKYINLYEIVTIQGQEGKGYASKIWELVMEDAYNSGMRRLKLSCTPDSVTWHNRNGLIFWAVDPTGSLRSDQPLFPTRKQQIEYRDSILSNPTSALPTDPKVLQKLKEESLESHGFGSRKTQTVSEAILAVGDSWLRNAFIQSFEETSLSRFM